MPGGHSSAPAGAARRLSALGMAVVTLVGSAQAVVEPTTKGPVTGPVLEVGDSLGIDLGWGLQEELAGSGHEFIDAALGDTGLAEPSFYDWPRHLAAEAAEYRPGLVVVFLGANDVENLYVDGQYHPFGSRGWAATYGQRVAGMMAQALTAGARVLWVGMPPMANSSFSADMATLNAVYRSEAARHGPGVDYFPSGNVLGGARGRYEQGPPGPGGEVLPWRTDDGIHITSAGALALARALVAQLRAKGWLAKIRPSAGGHKMTRRQTAHPVLEAQRGGVAPLAPGWEWERSIFRFSDRLRPEVFEEESRLAVSERGFIPVDLLSRL